MMFPVTEDKQRDALAKMWDIFPCAKESPLHQRALWGKGVPNLCPPKNITFNAEAYPSVIDRQQAFTEKALELNALGYNIYTCFNLISPEFGGDEYNGMAVKDADIVRRRYILIDFDRANSTQPATEDEVDAAIAATVPLELDIFCPIGAEPILTCSGNGAHIYLPVDLPNDQPSKILCRDLLVKLAAKYDTATVKIDVSVYNASRITKVLGTIARKGVEVPDPVSYNDRYYQMAQLIR